MSKLSFDPRTWTLDNLSEATTETLTEASDGISQSLSTVTNELQSTLNSGRRMARDLIRSDDGSLTGSLKELGGRTVDDALGGAELMLDLVTNPSETSSEIANNLIQRAKDTTEIVGDQLGDLASSIDGGVDRIAGTVFGNLRAARRELQDFARTEGDDPLSAIGRFGAEQVDTLLRGAEDITRLVADPTTVAPEIADNLLNLASDTVGFMGDRLETAVDTLAADARGLLHQGRLMARDQLGNDGVVDRTFQVADGYIQMLADPTTEIPQAVRDNVDFYSDVASGVADEGMSWVNSGLSLYDSLLAGSQDLLEGIRDDARTAELRADDSIAGSVQQYGASAVNGALAFGIGMLDTARDPAGSVGEAWDNVTGKAEELYEATEGQFGRAIAGGEEFLADAHQYVSNYLTGAAIGAMTQLLTDGIPGLGVPGLSPAPEVGVKPYMPTPGGSAPSTDVEKSNRGPTGS